jgi:hypothetical protein
MSKRKPIMRLASAFRQILDDLAQKDFSENYIEAGR